MASGIRTFGLNALAARQSGRGAFPEANVDYDQEERCGLKGQMGLVPRFLPPFMTPRALAESPQHGIEPAHRRGRRRSPAGVSP